MTMTVEATYENGVLRLVQPMPLKENERVQVTIERHCRRLSDSYGLIGWKGDAETVRRIALDPEFLLEESP